MPWAAPHRYSPPVSTEDHDSRGRPALTIALVAASSLFYWVLLTRVSALRLAFHLSFLVVANALLAVGA